MIKIAYDFKAFWLNKEKIFTNDCLLDDSYEITIKNLMNKLIIESQKRRNLK